MREFPVFVDCDDNRFIFPGLYVDEERSYDWSKCRSISLALQVEEEKERFVVTENETGELIFEHIKTRAGHHGFAHGSAEIYLIGGPTFDAVKAGTYDDE